MRSRCKRRDLKVRDMRSLALTCVGLFYHYLAFRASSVALQVYKSMSTMVERLIIALLGTY